MIRDGFFVYIVVMAGITYLIRMLPMVLIKKKITNRFILSFLHYIPYTVLSVMTVPAIFYATEFIPATIGFMAALVCAFREKSLVTVALIACTGVLITQVII